MRAVDLWPYIPIEGHPGENAMNVLWIVAFFLVIVLLIREAVDGFNGLERTIAIAFVSAPLYLFFHFLWQDHPFTTVFVIIFILLVVAIIIALWRSWTPKKKKRRWPFSWIADKRKSQIPQQYRN